MQVNITNAAVVAAIFNGLSDERFSMRTPQAIAKDRGIEPSAVLDVAAQIGLRQLTRVRDSAPLIQRPASVTAAQALEIATRAAALTVEGSTEAPFDLDYAPSPVTEHNAAVAAEALRDIPLGDAGSNFEDC